MRSLRTLSLLAVIVVAGIAAGCGGGDDDEDTTAPATTATETEAGGGGAQTVEMTEFEFTPNDLTAAQGDTITADNTGSVEHNLTIQEGADPEKSSAELAATPNVQPGDKADLSVDVDPGDHSIVCTISGHAEQGMIGTIKVE
jgi:plastocyanin